MLLRILLLLAIAGLALTINISIGDVNIAPSTAIQSVFTPQSLPADQAANLEIIRQVRLPRLAVAALVGAALAVSGYLLQSLSRNDLADPYLTGVSSGAGVTVALAIALSLNFEWIPLIAFAGGLASSVMVGTIARSPYGLSVTRLLLGGIGLSTICSGLITLIIHLGGDPVRAQGIFFWLAGGISGRTWQECLPASLYVVAGIIAALVFAKQLRLLSLGVEQARSLGTNVDFVQWSLLIIAVFLCGAAVSVSGLVGFVGLMAPHLARRLFGKDERLHLFACTLIGIVLVSLSDLMARSLISGQELPLSPLLSLLGGPFFLYLVSKQRAEEL